MSSKKIALFIDADNISAKFGKQIIETLERRGEIFIRRIYGNWGKVSLHGWNECILNFSLRAVQQPDYAAGKNATDMSLTIDAMDVLYGGKTEIFALVSNDSDFTPLAIRLREGGMKVIGMGNAHASNSFRMACDEFIDLDAPAKVEVPDEPKKKIHAPDKNPSVQLNLFAEEKIPPVTSPKVISISERQLQNDNDKKVQAIHDILHEAAKLHGDDSGFALLNCAGMEIKSKNLDFTVRDLGYSTLQIFIEAFPKLYEVQKQSNIVRYRCLSSEPKNFSADKLHDVFREASAVYAANDGFVNLWWVCDFIISNKKIDSAIKALSYNQLRDFIAKAPDLYEMTCRNNNEVFYRCRVAAPKVADDKLQLVHDVLRETAKLHADDKGFVSLSWAGDAIGKKNLNVKDLGYSTLSKFLSAFPNLYKVQGAGATISYCCLKDIQKNSERRDLQPIHAVLQATAKSYKDLNDSAGFTDLTRAGQIIHNEKLSIKGSGHSTLSKFVAAFPNLYDVKKVGKNFYYRCKS